METLSSTEPHYIRCIKPNSLNCPQKFENGNVLQQLRSGVSSIDFLLSHPNVAVFWSLIHINDSPFCLTHLFFICFILGIIVVLIWFIYFVSLQGVLEAIRISLAGYPTRRTYSEFINRFGLLVPEHMDERWYANINTLLLRTLECQIWHLSVV